MKCEIERVRETLDADRARHDTESGRQGNPDAVPADRRAIISAGAATDQAGSTAGYVSNTQDLALSRRRWRVELEPEPVDIGFWPTSSKGSGDDQKDSGEEIEPGTKQADENACLICAGSGEVDGKPCPDCDGPGRITVIVGDA